MTAQEIIDNMKWLEEHKNVRTLGELIKERYPDYRIQGGSASMDMDITHGVEIDTMDNSKYGYGITVSIYPHIKWTDGSWRPCHYWGSEYYIMLTNR